MNRFVLSSGVIAGLLVWPVTTLAQDPVLPETVSRTGDGQITTRAIPLEYALQIDGQLTEELYETVRPISDFRQNEPINGAPATERTEIWISFDSDNLYVSVRAYESEPERVVANEMQRDSFNIFQNANVGVMFDTFNDRRSAIVFQFNPIGGRMDGQVAGTGGYNGDWNPVWELAVGEFDGGWTGEASIPFKSISYGPGDVWGFNARRINMWKNEVSYLTDLPAGRGNQGITQPSFGAPLVGIEAPPNSRTVDIKPYAIADVTTNVPANLRNDPSADAGLDARVSLTPNLNADFTVNTDFAQVEADEQQVNLTRFSLFFPEKREFFLENEGLFSFGGAGGFGGFNNTPTLFYSRRIGLEAGQAVPIRAGGRLTGRVGDYAVGLINIHMGDDDELGVPGTNFTVARVRRDILRRSSIGAIATVRSDTVDRLGAAATYGVDGAFSFNDVLEIDTYWATVDNPGISDDNNSYRARVQYDDDLYDVSADHIWVGKNFVPEVGFVRRTDMRRTRLSGSYSPRPASIAAIRQFQFGVAAMHVENGEGTVEDRRVRGEAQIQFESGDSFQAEYADDYELLPFTFEVSDGVVVPAGPYEGGDFQLAYQLGQQRRVSGSFGFQRSAFYDGTSTEFGYTGGRVEVHPQLSVEPGLQFNIVETPFGDFTTELVSARVTYTVTPLLFISSLQQYNSTNASLSTNVRMRWEYQPGSELFVVYNDGRTTEGDRFAQLQNWSFVVKINRLFRF